MPQTTINSKLFSPGYSNRTIQTLFKRYNLNDRYVDEDTTQKQNFDIMEININPDKKTIKVFGVDKGQSEHSRFFSEIEKYVRRH